MNIAVTTLYTSNLLTNSFISKKLPNYREYVNYHNYSNKEYRGRIDKTRPAQWSKIKAVYELLETEKFDWVFWCDADTLFMNKEKKLESYIDPNYDVIFCSDLSSTLWVNSGAFFIKNTEFSRRFLKKVYNDDNYYVNKKNEFDWDQGSLREVLYENRMEDKVKIIESPDNNLRFQHFWYITDPIPLFNKNNNYFSEKKIRRELIYTPGDFIVHFAGCQNKAYLYSQFERLRKKYL